MPTRRDARGKIFRAGPHRRSSLSSIALEAEMRVRACTFRVGVMRANRCPFVYISIIPILSDLCNRASWHAARLARQCGWDDVARNDSLCEYTYGYSQREDASQLV